MKANLAPRIAAGIDDHALDKVLRRARKLPACDQFNRPAWAECVIPEFLTLTKRRTPFLLYDSIIREPSKTLLKLLN